ncbi:hypothetical protein K1X13_16680 [Nocardioides sp. WL0053]|uniref:MinD-like ATPase involved in chromosome partitioning or flagellar assembly n=1 Tax=Nocardioides jiangsuensis TaxID=2866161 RepID=A0ABS7RN63_9ACTN|nr:hypothetical protein [Nocardioides jiangsuensis]MBY9076472.1 hypothetical protein [Nocardioides jiangsuensis]
MLGERVSVLTAAAGAGWEVTALQQLAHGDPRVVLLKRCVDLHDLLATASTGQGRVALVADDLAGLDADSVDRLRRCGLAVVVVSGEVGGAPGRAPHLGVSRVLDRDALHTLVDQVLAVAADTDQTVGVVDGVGEVLEVAPDDAAEGRLVAVWGPTGAPGRTTLAVGLAAELAHRQQTTFLVDADTYGGAVAQHLGVLDEVSGLLGAARLANAGRLDRERLAGVARRLGPHLHVLTGLPRPDRWSEVRESAYATLLDEARGLGSQVVLDLGFGLEQDPPAYGGAAPQRNQMTVTALERADEVLVVGSADPVGLARLARGLVDLLGVVPGSTVRVVVNRVRPSLGWGEKEVRAMVEGFVTPASMHFLPDDRQAADRALVAGRTLVELGDSPLRRGVAEVADAVLGGNGAETKRTGRRWRAARSGGRR